MSFEPFVPTNATFAPDRAGRLPVTRVRLYQPESAWTYSHHPHLAQFQGRLYAMWSNGREHEDAVGQRVLLASSADGLAWTPPQPLLDSQPGRFAERVLTAAGFHRHAGQLVAYVGQYEYNQATVQKHGGQPAGEGGHTGTTLLAMTTRDGVHWSPPCDLGVPIVPNHGPQATASGRLIVAGNFSFPWSDEPAGLGPWTVTGLLPAGTPALADDSEGIWEAQRRQGWPVCPCEGAFLQTADGVLHMFLRSASERLWLSDSRDDGLTWSPPHPTEFSDNVAKFHLGRLPDGRFYYVGCPLAEPRWQRCPLVLSLAVDGQRFDHHFILADTAYPMPRPGKYKGGEYGYPHTLVHDGRLDVIVSRQKEAVEVLSVPLAALPPRT